MIPVSATVLVGSLALCSVVVLIPGAPPQNPVKGSDLLRYTGPVGEWWVTAPGRVQFQIVGSGRAAGNAKQADLWFETPADKDLNTLFENLVLEVVVHSVEKGVPITVEAKNSSGDDGSTHEKAFDIVRAGLGGS